MEGYVVHYLQLDGQNEATTHTNMLASFPGPAYLTLCVNRR